MTRCVLLLLAALLLAGCQPDAALATGCSGGDAALAAGCCDAALAAGGADAATACYVPVGVQILAFVGLATLVLLALGLVLFMGGLVQWMREGYRYPRV